MQEPAAVVRDYIRAMGAGAEGLTRARRLLADDLAYSDPLMSAVDADDLIRQVAALGGAEKPARVVALAAQDDQVAALTAFPGPGGEDVMFSQWFTVTEGRIQSIRVFYDPRPFLAAGPQT